MPPEPKKVMGVYEREPGNWCGRYRSPEGKLVRKSFGMDRRAAVEWVEEARVIRRTGTLPTSARVKKEPPVKTDRVRTVAVAKASAGATDMGKLIDEETIDEVGSVSALCAEFLLYIRSHPEEYRDQKNPPRRTKEIRNAFKGRVASDIKPPEIEQWLDGIQEDRELANATINKLRGTFSMLYKHGKRKGLVDVNPAEEVPLKDPGNGIERSCPWTRSGVCGP